jgi:hypothetical protein
MGCKVFKQWDPIDENKMLLSSAAVPVSVPTVKIEEQPKHVHAVEKTGQIRLF